METKPQGFGAIQKKWDTQTSDEKIETLRNEVRNNRYLVSRILKLETMLKKLEEHTHADGKVVIPITFREYDQSCGSYDLLA